MRLQDFRQRRRRRNAKPGGTWFWRSFDDLHDDLRDFSQRLPAVRAVCGIPRSGVVVAAQLATLLGLPLVSIDDLRAGAETGWRPSIAKPLRSRDGKILVVDDTIWSGRAMWHAREQIGDRDDVIFGAVYANPETRDGVDVSGFDLPSIDHTFAWNVLRDVHARDCLTDMDGVLCPDWPGDANDDGPAYQQWLNEVPTRIVPSYPLGGIVTARCATFREATQSWLRRHHIEHQRLVMPFADVASRRGQCAATAKAAVYRESSSRLFVESSREQAEIIHQLTGRPVVCTDSLEMLQ